MNKKGMVIAILILGMLSFTAIPVMAFENDPVQVDDLYYFGSAYVEQRNLVRMANNSLLLVYGDLISGEERIGYATSDDDGVTWTQHGSIGDEIFSEYPCVARDSHDRVWCAYETWTGITERVNITYYKNGIWATPTTVDVELTDQYEPFVCVDSHDNVYVVWDQDTAIGQADYYQIFETSFTFVQFPNSIPDPLYIDPSPMDQEYPSAALDGNDTLHIGWEGSDSNVYYAYVDYGYVVYVANGVNVRPTGHGTGYFRSPSICVSDIGTVYIACMWVGPSDNDLYVIYGTHPDGTQFFNMSDELSYSTNTWGESCGWLNDELQIVYSDIDTGLINYINGTPALGWNQETDISVGDPSVNKDQIYPSIRWAYYDEQDYTVEYVFTNSDSEIMFYQQIEHGTPPNTLINQINSLVPLVTTIMGVMIVLVIFKGIARSFDRMSKKGW